ncbi:hypothetical protein ACFLXJ_06715 [Chloroflexota bacterium]
MTINIRRLRVLAILIAVLVLGVVLLAFSYSDIGIARSVGTGGLPLPEPDVVALPESVVEDAQELSAELFGEYQEKYDDFSSQLLAAYAEARDKDFVVIFNSGGWGWNFLESSPGWHSICTGIELELRNLGYDSLVLDYRRTEANLRGIIDEGVEMITNYPSKAETLARRVEFLTKHVPNLKVIVAGESDGTVISGTVMDILRDNPQVYSIQTGTPFWYKSTTEDRTLVVNNNGMYPDSFSQGDIPAMLWTSLQDLVGWPQPVEKSGRVLYWLRAPGHDYRWQYPAVYYQITNFLKENFGPEQ